ncbi:UDP-3-O-(3-hydroxymyristoyl)glucosamine N-acyltransferase, partial [Desulfosarcina sp.]|uniref:UDP-3-O-(3-hydroxymyristoyl)glucosamine N-acyltransferase n=1 Tax=Desulfosarcina sp. TaxID=2027861 RepID=UPI0035676A82
MPTEYSLEAIAEATNGEAVGQKKKKISSVAPFETADSNQITFAGSVNYLKRIDDTRAGAILVPTGFKAPGKNLIGVSNPQLAFAKVVALFHPTVPPPPGINKTAAIGSDLRTGDGVYIGAFTSVGNRVTIGADSIIQDGVFIGDGVIIGDKVLIHPHVTIMNGCRIGNRVTIHPGSVIGSDGYGFVAESGRYHKIPQIGIVQIDDDVEIGACNTIDRATFGRTWIQRGVKTDNLVHIAHNVVVGEDSLIVAQVGIAGSTQIGHHAILAGQAGISGHLTIGSHVTVGPMTGVGKSISDGEVVSSGSP